jgi:hypothetical protein
MANGASAWWVVAPPWLFECLHRAHKRASVLEGWGAAFKGPYDLPDALQAVGDPAAQFEPPSDGESVP